MKSVQTLLSAKPTLWFLFLFNLAIALAVGFEPVADSLGLAGVQQIVTCVGMGLVSLGAGAALLRRRLQLV
ncbi:hypothetical protein ACQPZ2_15540 [Nocardia pseudovaccinii]|uniref:hypothetical protein n=1 Tax=Nocardia pseudovaccinii TaxID=189540 RepID=UPI003D8D1AA9